MSHRYKRKMVIKALTQRHAFFGQWKADKGLHIAITFVLSLKVSKIQRPKAVFDYPTVVWRPLSREPREYPHKPCFARKYSHQAIFLRLTVLVCLYSSFRGGLRKTHVFWSRVHSGRPMSSKVVDFGTNRKHVCDFLLVISSSLHPILSRIRDIAGFLFKSAAPSHSTRNLGIFPVDQIGNVGCRSAKILSKLFV